MKRWMISLDEGATFNMNVQVANAVEWNLSRKLNEGQIFHRIKLSTALVITRPTFDSLHSLERTSVNRCKTIYIRRERLCNGGWRVQWTGRFSPGSAEWDLDECQMTVTPDVVDRYTCILDILDKKANLLSVPPVTIIGTILPSSMEYLACYGSAPGSDCADAAGLLNGWGLLDVQADPCAVAATVQLYVRERITTNCVAGAPVPPAGTGWILLEDNCASNGTAVYVRTPLSFPSATFSATCGPDPNDPVLPAGACDQWVYLTTQMADPIGPTFVHYWACFASITYRNARPLDQVLAFMIEECPDLIIASDFLEINPPGDAPGYVAGENYVTGSVNQWSGIHVMDCSDVADPGSSDPATNLERSLGELFETFLALMRCYWFIDDQDRLRIEHWSYFGAVDGLDTTSDDHSSFNRGNNRYKHLSDEIPKYERLIFVDALGVDFAGRDVVYSGQCVGREQEVEEISADCITDLRQIAEFPTSVDLDAMVLLAVSGGSVINDTGAITGGVISNAPMSKANLQDAFWRHDRYLWSGELNGEEVKFSGIRPNIEQSGVKAKYCCELLALDPNDAVITELGMDHLQGRRGMIEKAKLRDQDDLLEMDLRYSY